MARRKRTPEPDHVADEIYRRLDQLRRFIRVPATDSPPPYLEREQLADEIGALIESARSPAAALIAVRDLLQEQGRAAWALREVEALLGAEPRPMAS